MWIPFHGRKVGAPIIKFFTNRHGGKYPEAEATGLSWYNGRELLDWANFSTWENDGTINAKPRRFNTHLLYNVTKEDGDYLQQHSEMHSLLLSSRSDSYVVTKFTNKDKKKQKKISHKGQRKTHKRKKGEEDAETSDDSIGSSDSSLSRSSSAYTSLSKNDINSDSSSSGDFMLIAPRRNVGKCGNN